MNTEEMLETIYSAEERIKGKRIRCIYFHPERMSEFLVSARPSDPLINSGDGWMFGAVNIKEDKAIPISPGYFIEYYE